MKALRIVWFVVFLYGCLFGCNDDSEETESDGEAQDGVQIEAGSDTGETVFDGGRLDSNTAEAGMDADTDSRTSPSRDAGLNSGDYCPPGIDEYDDAGVNVYISDAYGDSYLNNDPIARLHILCFTKGVDCEKYTIDIHVVLDTFPRLNSYTTYQSLSLPAMPFNFPNDEQPITIIDPGIDSDSDWSVEITGASVKYSEYSPPGCDGKPEPDLYLEGTSSMVQIECVDEDTVPEGLYYSQEWDYVVLKDEQGNVVLDTRE